MDEFNTPVYQFEDWQLIGPDEFGATSTSGDGLVIDGNNVGTPKMILRNFSSLHFGGGRGMFGNFIFESVWDTCLFKWNDIGLELESANADTFVNVTCDTNTTCGAILSGSGSSWIGGLFQTNKRTGLRLANAQGWNFSGTYLEANNSTLTAGEYGIDLRSATGAGVQNILFSACKLTVGDRDTVNIGGPGPELAVNICFKNTFYQKGASPQVNVASTALNCSFEDSFDIEDVTLHPNAVRNTRFLRSGGQYFYGRSDLDLVNELRGSDIASASSIAPGYGNYFHVTGTTQINHIATARLRAGSCLEFYFVSGLPVNHNAASPPVGYAPVLFPGALRSHFFAGDTLRVRYNGTSFIAT
jgi:hypothetical protein